MKALERFWEFVSRNMASIRLDFGPKDHQKELTLTFGFLTGIISVLVVLTAIWSVAAGVLQAGRFAFFAETRFHGPWFWMELARFVGPVLLIPVYALKAFSVSVFVCFAAASLGAIIGFLFGVPRPISETGVVAPAPTVPTAAPAPRGAVPGSAESGRAAPDRTPESGGTMPGWQASTNLTQVSDWLTKIIVGVGLVEASTIYERVTTISQRIGAGLFEGAIATPIVVPCLMISGFVIGFTYAYLFTQLFLAALMASSARLVSDPENWLAKDVATLQAMSGVSSAVARPIGTAADASARPMFSAATTQQKEAATNIGAVSLDSLAEPGAVQAWARGRAILDDYAGAARGYHKLLQSWRTPDVLAEAARVFAANDEDALARRLLLEAVEGRDGTDAVIRSRITADAANLALYDPPPAGFTQALQWLDEQAMRYDPLGNLHVLRACAGAQCYAFRRAELTEKAAEELRRQVLDDVAVALRNGDNRSWLRYLWDPNDPRKAGMTAARRDDDLEVFHGDEAFSKLIAPEVGAGD